MRKASQTRAIIIITCLLSQAVTARATPGGPEIAKIPGWNPAQRVTELADAYVKAWFKAFHEVWPGHHLQISLAQERPQAHPITRYLSNAGFAEGWARYADTILADEMGLYSSDFNRLSMYAGVPHAMVEDPGLHALGWTRQQVIDYILAKSPNTTPERAATDVDRMAITPGQVTTYGLGEQELFALREEARQALGPKFVLREFHDRVLENGSLTLGMLRKVIERWIAEKKAGG